MSIVGANMKVLREAAGLSQAQLAVMAGLSSVKAIERGRRGGRLSSLQRIADALGVPLARLFVKPDKHSRSKSRRRSA